MHPPDGQSPSGESVLALLAGLEELSRTHPDRVLRLRGTLPADPGQPGQPGQQAEFFELLLFRGFSSSITHPTAFDPDSPLLPEGTHVAAAELLRAPLKPGEAEVLAGPIFPHLFLDPGRWR
jgi:hypothetical protein